MDTDDISPLIREKAPLILEEIKKAKSILLHCHPSPDPDSLGSSLAMKFALEGMGKKATVIAGDSKIPAEFMHFPGAKEIIPKNIFETDLSQFDLFIVLDTGSFDRISGIAPFVVPEHLTVINIDHHASNEGFGDIDLVVPTYPAACQILYDLFSCWNVPIAPDIASDLFIGIYTDTGGFRYRATTVRTFEIASKLIAVAPDFTTIISTMENSSTPEALKFRGLALNSIETFLGDHLALSLVSNAQLVENDISETEASTSMISPLLIRVAKWDIAGSMCELKPGVTKVSFRSKDIATYDVSKLASALGGGGHKAAAAAVIKLPLEDAKKLVVAKAKELYNL